MAKGKKTGGRDWKPGESGNPDGLKPMSTEARIFKRMTQAQVAELGTEILSGNVDALRKVVKNPTSTPLQVWFATSVLKGIAKGDVFALDKFLERVVGKVKDKIDLSSSDGSMKPTFVFKTVVNGNRD